jgi:hypothetical protein
MRNVWGWNFCFFLAHKLVKQYNAVSWFNLNRVSVVTDVVRMRQFCWWCERLFLIHQGRKRCMCAQRGIAWYWIVLLLLVVVMFYIYYFNLIFYANPTLFYPLSNYIYFNIVQYNKLHLIYIYIYIYIYP